MMKKLLINVKSKRKIDNEKIFFKQKNVNWYIVFCITYPWSEIFLWKGINVFTTKLCFKWHISVKISSIAPGFNGSFSASERF